MKTVRKSAGGQGAASAEVLREGLSQVMIFELTPE